MSMATTSKTRSGAGSFGVGGSEPYDTAIANGYGRLRMTSINHAVGAQTVFDVAQFIADADDVDLAVLDATSGPVLDVGSGPGRMVRAAIGRQRLALGIDLSARAVATATAHGLPVLQRSVFTAVPMEGWWSAVLLLDGNIGIGGDPTRLLQRCRRLIGERPRASVLVECSPTPLRDERFDAIVTDELDRASEPFPWAEVGSTALGLHARRAGMHLTDRWEQGGRAFALLGAH
jgi:SAM-dependent methyltransferase